jgi:hypothetical protein
MYEEPRLAFNSHRRSTHYSLAKVTSQRLGYRKRGLVPGVCMLRLAWISVEILVEKAYAPGAKNSIQLVPVKRRTQS